MSFNDPSLNVIILWFAAVTSLVTISVIFALLILCIVKRRRFDISPETYENHHYGRRREPPCQGLSPSVIASFPSFSNKSDDKDLESNCPEIECPVCLGLIPKNGVVKVLPNCMHMFDEECIGKWLESHSTCPVCRSLAEPMACSEDKVYSTADPCTETSSSSEKV